MTGRKGRVVSDTKGEVRYESRSEMDVPLETLNLTEKVRELHCEQGCQMAKFDPFLSLDCARVGAWGRNPRKGRDQISQRSVAEP